MGITFLTKPDGSTYFVNVTNGAYQVSFTDDPDLGYSENWAQDAVEILRPVSCDWTDQDNFKLDCLGYSQIVGGVLTRQLPEKHPFYTSMWCVGVRTIKNFGKAIINPLNSGFDYYNARRGDIDYATNTANASIPTGRAFFMLTYRRLPYDVLGDYEVSSELQRFVHKDETWATEHLPLPGSSLKFSDSGAVINERFPLPLHARSFVYKWFNIPCNIDGSITSALDTAISSCVGATNSVTFDGHAAGTLLCEPVETEFITMANGDFGRHFTYRFTKRSQLWNSKYRAPDGTHNAGFYGVVNNDGTGAKPIPEADFNTLFVV